LSTPAIEEQGIVDGYVMAGEDTSHGGNERTLRQLPWCPHQPFSNTDALTTFYIFFPWLLLSAAMEEVDDFGFLTHFAERVWQGIADGYVIADEDTSHGGAGHC